jgi:hypothetical protein
MPLTVKKAHCSQVKDCLEEDADWIKLDTLYGYACGESKNKLLQHLPCIQRVLNADKRMKSSEDEAMRGLLYIVNSDDNVATKQARIQSCLFYEFHLKQTCRNKSVKRCNG